MASDAAPKKAQTQNFTRQKVRKVGLYWRCTCHMVVENK
jgi:hypothetical protein